MTNKIERQKEILALIEKMYPGYQIVIIAYNEEGDISEFGYGCPKCASEVLIEVADKHLNDTHLVGDERIH